jgi:hypothetical protein
MRYVADCGACGVVLCVGSDPPSRQDVERVERHQHRHFIEALDARLAAANQTQNGHSVRTQGAVSGSLARPEYSRGFAA